VRGLHRHQVPLRVPMAYVRHSVSIHVVCSASTVNGDKHVPTV
jgi:hypothetical protein